MKHILYTIVFALFTTVLIAQQVGISDDPLHAPDSSAILDLSSNTKGLLIQTDVIPSG